MCVIKKYVCTRVLVIFERSKTRLQITIPTTLCTSRLLRASNVDNVVLYPNKILLNAIFLRYQPQIWNTTSLDLLL